MKYGEWTISECGHAATKTTASGEEEFEEYLVKYRNCALVALDGLIDLTCRECGALVEDNLDALVCNVVEAA